MKKLFRRLICAGLICLTLPTICTATPLTPAKEKQLTQELTAMVGDTGTQVPGLGVIVYKDGKKAYSKFLGRRSINPDRPITADTRFRIASVSKQFTVFSIMQLVEQKRLDLDKDVSQYLGFQLRNPNYPTTPITLRMLLSHTSSLRDGKLYAIPPQYSIQEFFTPQGKFWEDGAHFAPAGQAPAQYFQYSNINYGIAGTILEAVTKTRFDRYQKEHILKDLDIKGDYVVGNLSPKSFSNLGTIYQKNNNGTWNEKGPWYAQIDEYKKGQPAHDLVRIQNPDHRDTDAWYSVSDYKVGTNATPFSPQGSLYISYNELSHCLEFLLHDGKYKGKQVLSPESLATIFTPHWRYDAKLSNGNTYGGSLECYGLGETFIIGDSTSRACRDKVINLEGHMGEAYGLLSGIFRIPNTKNGFIYISNGEAIAEDDDPRSSGKFSGNYIWEENTIDAICRAAF